MKKTLVRCLVFTLAVPVIVQCANVPSRGKYLPLTSLQELIANPEHWNGQRLSVEGWAVRDHENYNLYANYDDACDDRAEAQMIAANWEDRHLASGTMRLGVFRGIFNNHIGPRGDGSVVVSTGSPGPGPLDNIEVIEWRSSPAQSCS